MLSEGTILKCRFSLVRCEKGLSRCWERTLLSKHVSWALGLAIPILVCILNFGEGGAIFIIPNCVLSDPLKTAAPLSKRSILVGDTYSHVQSVGAIQNFKFCSIFCWFSEGIVQIFEIQFRSSVSFYFWKWMFGNVSEMNITYFQSRKKTSSQQTTAGLHSWGWTLCCAGITVKSGSISEDSLFLTVRCMIEGETV